MMARHATSASAQQAAAAPRAIRPGLLIALLVMLAATAWALLDGDEPAPTRSDQASRRAASAPPAAAPSPLPEGARSLRAARSEAAAAPGAQPLAPQRAEQLAQWALRWQARGQIVALGETGHAAWASKLPPPPPPLPKVASSAPPPPPMAPPFPYQWIGRWQEQDGGTGRGAEPHASAAPAVSASAATLAPQARYLAVIAGPANTWVAKVGDVIDGQWRIDAITDTTVRVTFLPLSQTQTLALRRS